MSSATDTQRDLRYSDVEEELRASVRKLLVTRSAPLAVLARCESTDPYDLGLWQTITVELKSPQAPPTSTAPH